MKVSIRKSDLLLSGVSSFLYDLPSPSSISYLWNFGSMLGVFLGVQILTGLFLAIHFSGDVNLAFVSVVHLMRDVKWGWLIRFLHSNGASFFFVFIYCHMARGIYYGSYSNFYTWMSGVTIFILSMLTAFLGYVLPWGQMSFWAATVITNLLSAVPYFGVTLVEWVWGGFAVGNPTLTRFFSFHFIFPMVILFLVIVHLIYLHEKGSFNPLGMNSNLDKIEFHSFFSLKDSVSLMVVFFFLMMISLLSPYVFMDCDNFLMSNPLVTPIHIQPEWYFLFAYCILRSISSKVGGVIALLMSVLIFYFFPFFMGGDKSSMMGYFLGKFLFWVIIFNWVLLTWIGSCLVEYPFVEMGKIFSFLYFFLFFLVSVVMKIQDKFYNWF